MKTRIIRCAGLAIMSMLAPAAMAAIFTVTNTSDSGAGSLRDAINNANGNAGADVIQFNITSPGVVTIALASPLPPLTDQAGVTIDGFTQPGASAGPNPPATLNVLVELDGSGSAPAGHGIHIRSSNNVVRGLCVRSFPHDGISIEAVNQNQGGANDNVIEYNLVGTDPGGMVAFPNGTATGGLWAGIYVKVLPNSEPVAVALRNIIRRNLSSGNQGEGIGIASCPDVGDCAFNEVLGNHVGTDILGLGPLGNLRTGVYLGEGTHDNFVGETSGNVADPNTICANGYEGVSIVGYAEAEPNPWFTDDNLVRWNRIGVNVNLVPLGNSLSGVAIGAYGAQNYQTQGHYFGGHARRNVVADNVIAHNLRCGVIVWEWGQTDNLRPDNASFNTIRQNSIYENGNVDPGYLGIDLQFDGVTFNDYGQPPDTDSGPNRFVNFPDDFMTVVYNGAGTATVSGTIAIDSNPAQAMVEVFRAVPDTTGPPWDPAPTHGEGAVYLGTAVPTAGGTWTLNVSGVAPGDSLTATTTDVNGNTSEFARNMIVDGQDEVDFGDAPDPSYPTLFVRNGARHVINPQMFLGASVDGEPDGQPSAMADGDDLNPPGGPDDEDGVSFGPLVPGTAAQFTVYPSQQGRIDAWIDFNADGDWYDAGEQVASSVAVSPPSTVINFNVPATAPSGVSTFARVRYSNVGGLAVTGTASDGEVEDHLVMIQQGQEPDEFDFGDAPDSSAAPLYPTLLANNGARHQIVIGGPVLGNVIDAEPDGQPATAADGDDNNLIYPGGPDDEDGVVFPTALIVPVPAAIQVTSATGGILQGWIDWNGDGDWLDTGEQVITNLVLPAGTTSVPITVPWGATGGANGLTYARFRISSIQGLGFAGPAPDGEVEDYLVRLEELKWLQIPEQGQEGVDVSNADHTLADDFQCTASGPITDIHIWGSFLGDNLPEEGPGGLTFDISIWSDVPVGPGNPVPHSHPGQKLWQMTFTPGQYSAGHILTVVPGEWWHDPGTQNWIPNADQNIYQFDFYPPKGEAFVQEEGTIYWLAVKYSYAGPSQWTGKFGWKTTPQPWNDDACYQDPASPVGWTDMIYQSPHPWWNAEDPLYRSVNLAFALSGEEPEEETDWGDAPDPTYPTLRSNNGARHTIVQGYHMGASIDAEPDGQPSVMADGDDLNPPGSPDDEDGVFFYPLIVGQQGALDVSVTGSGFIDAWIDFNGNGSWLDAGEQIAASVAVTAGRNQIVFNVPAGAVTGPTYVRVRFSSMGGLLPTGSAPDGEVEDYRVDILPEGEPVYDFGDAPDPMYPTLAASNGARHLIGGPLWLGQVVDPEPDGQPDPAALGDDNNLFFPGVPDDEDGVSLPYALIGGQSSLMQVTASAPGFIDVWIDWNANGSWADLGDNVLSAFAVTPGVNYIMIAVPPLTYTGPTMTRVRISSTGYLPPTGFAQDGEVEDHEIFLYEEGGMDFGDAPDLSIGPTTNYETTMMDLGAAHFIDSLFLGWLIDAEPDGQPSLGATGDDFAGLADEDGVAFTSPWISGVAAQVNVTVNPAAAGPAYDLDLWVDWNGDGTWAQANEHVLAAIPVVPGMNQLTIPVPSGLNPFWTYARFRLTHPGTGVGYTGYVFGGEVEDYMIPIGMRVQAGISVNRSTIPPQAVLTWPAVTGAANYSIYSSTNLGTGFPNPPNWTLETTTASLTWSDPITVAKKFYIVVAFP